MTPSSVDRSVMSLGDHLDELRRRLVLALAAPLPLMVGLFFVSDGLLGVILRPHYEAMAELDLPPVMQVLSPPEMVLVKMKISFIFALVLSAPWVFYHAWMFVAPGLYRSERRFVYLLVPGSVLLTAIGLLLLYYVMLPLMLQVLVLFGANFRVDIGPRLDAETAAIIETVEDVALRTRPPAAPAPGDAWVLLPEMQLWVTVEGAGGVAEPLEVRARPAGGVEQPWRLRETVDFTLLLLAAVVISFQLPLAMMLLGWTGIVDWRLLAGQRRYALFGCAIASAVLTPQDVVSMMLMMVPLYGLYELGLLMMRFLPASRVARGRGDGEDGADDPDGKPPSAPTDEPPAGDRPPPGSVPSSPAPDRTDDDVPSRTDPSPEPEPTPPVPGSDEAPEAAWPRPAGDTVARSRGFAVDPAADDAVRERRDGKDAT